MGSTLSTSRVSAAETRTVSTIALATDQTHHELANDIANSTSLTFLTSRTRRTIYVMAPDAGAGFTTPPVFDPTYSHEPETLNQTPTAFTRFNWRFRPTAVSTINNLATYPTGTLWASLAIWAAPEDKLR